MRRGRKYARRSGSWTALPMKGEDDDAVRQGPQQQLQERRLEAGSTTSDAQGVGASISIGSAPGQIDIEELLATRLPVRGNSGSGKSHLLRRLLEESAPFLLLAKAAQEGADEEVLARTYGTSSPRRIASWTI